MDDRSESDAPTAKEAFLLRRLDAERQGLNKRARRLVRHYRDFIKTPLNSQAFKRTEEV